MYTTAIHRGDWIDRQYWRRYHEYLRRQLELQAQQDEAAQDDFENLNTCENERE